jgi:hypothetical protein
MVAGMLALPSFREKAAGLLLHLAQDPILGVRAALAHSLRGEAGEAVGVLRGDPEECVWG